MTGVSGEDRVGIRQKLNRLGMTFGRVEVVMMTGFETEIDGAKGR